MSTMRKIKCDDSLIRPYTTNHKKFLQSLLLLITIEKPDEDDQDLKYKFSPSVTKTNTNIIFSKQLVGRKESDLAVQAIPSESGPRRSENRPFRGTNRLSEARLRCAGCPVGGNHCSEVDRRQEQLGGDAVVGLAAVVGLGHMEPGWGIRGEEDAARFQEEERVCLCCK
ncbi:hypothetical protein L2E82_40301 [Cichorium intybus]|uniref:Uncharacterized protein n=1 Tax=Cichorium intybus TaxID=13427 RepID=A0ACB9AL00_CICIN|nr:hypothetical protein L2E82_40301 [Cichorium intybus]